MHLRDQHHLADPAEGREDRKGVVGRQEAYRKVIEEVVGNSVDRMGSRGSVGDLDGDGVAVVLRGNRKVSRDLEVAVGRRTFLVGDLRRIDLGVRIGASVDGVVGVQLSTVTPSQIRIQ